MIDSTPFRLWCAGLALFLQVGATALRGQTISNCSPASAVPVIVRAEGLAELAGDIILNCSSADTSLIADVEVTLPATITSRILRPADLTNAFLPTDEAFLLLDDPSPEGGPAPTLGRNVFLGTRVGSNRIRWSNVPIFPFFAVVDSTGPISRSRLIRITNVRFNAPQLSQSADSVEMRIRITSGQQVLVDEFLVVVASVQPGMSFDVQNTSGGSEGVPVTFPQSVSVNRVPGPSANTNFNLRYTEGFANSFKQRNVATSVTNPTAVADQAIPGHAYNTETGFYNTHIQLQQVDSVTTARFSELAGLAGLADSGTRLVAQFSNVPSGVSLFVTLSPVSAGTSTTGITARLISTDPDGRGPFVPVPASNTVSGGVPIAPVPLTGGSGAVTWEVLNPDPAQIEFVSFGVLVSYSADPAANSPSPGTANVSGELGPFSAAGQADRSSPLPRFSPVTGSREAFTIIPVPSISGISREETTAGALDFDLMITGQGFVREGFIEGLPGSRVFFNGSPLATTFLSEGQLTARVTQGVIGQPGTVGLQIVNPGNLASNVVNFTINPRPMITTQSLPGVTQDTDYAQGVTASGGTLPYTWSVHPDAPLPAGLSLNSQDGTITGRPSQAGTFAFLVQVTDSVGVTASRPLRIRVDVVPTLLVDVPDTVEPNQEQTVYVRLASPFRNDVTGKLSLTFVPDIPADSVSLPAGVMLLGDARLSTDGQFTIHGGDLRAVADIRFKTGTLAGMLEFTASAEGTLVVRTETRRSQVVPRPPVFEQPILARPNASSLVVQIKGFSTTREVSEATFGFTLRPDRRVEAPGPIAVKNAFDQWFGDPASNQAGGSFCYLQSFTIAGDPNEIEALSVSLRNGVDVSEAQVVRFGPLNPIPTVQLSCP